MSEITFAKECNAIVVTDFTPKTDVYRRVPSPRINARMWHLTKLVEEAYEKSTSVNVISLLTDAPVQNIRPVYYRSTKIEPKVHGKGEPDLRREFRNLADAWHRETAPLSSTSEIVSNFNYYRIISLGEKVVPLILQELETKGGQWYLALRVITNENPVPEADIGNIKKMKSAWLHWGKQHGLI